MNQYYSEQRLCWCYGLLSVMLGVSVVCIAVAYNHWRATLDLCPGNYLENQSCDCIFYGVTASVYFNGGHKSYCLYAVFAPLPIFAYSIIMAFFHMYRVCIKNAGRYEDEKTMEMEEIEGTSMVMTTRTRMSRRNDGIIYCWIPTSCIAAIFAVYNLIHAGLITDGFQRTCNQYRGQLVRQMGIAGDQAAALRFRLSCQAIFDFMDYVHKDPMNHRGGDFINTGVALHLALITSWIAVALWIAVVVLTALRAHKERDVLTCCGN